MIAHKSHYRNILFISLPVHVMVFVASFHPALLSSYIDT